MSKWRPPLSFFGPRARWLALVVWAWMGAPLVVGGEAAQAATQRFALIVGNDDGGPGTTPLRHAESDAKRIRDVLVELGGFAESQLVLLRGKEAHEVREAALRLQEVIARLDSSTADHVVFLFYYSGHGTEESLELGASRLPTSDIKAILDASGADMRLAIVDACHSGSLVRTKGGRRVDAFPLVVEDQMASSGYAILTSSAASEVSHESDDLESSFFTHALTSGLRGDADYSQDRRITLGELYQYAYHATLRRSQLAQQPQHPHLELAQQGELVLTQLDRASALLTFPPAVSGNFLVFDPQSEQVLAEVVKIAGETRSIAVRPGPMHVYQRDDAAVRLAKVDVEPEREVVVDASLLEPLSEVRATARGPRVGFWLGAQAGYQMFLDPTVRSSYVDNTPLFGVALRITDVGVAGLDLGVDTLFGVDAQGVDLYGSPSQQDLFVAQVGLTAQWRWDWGPLFAAIGPRISWIYLRRDVRSPAPEAGDTGPQDVSTVSPGAIATLGYSPHPRIQLTAVTRAGYLRLRVEGEDTHLATLDVLAGVSTSF